MFSLAQITGIGQEKYETKIHLLKSCRLVVLKRAYLKEQQVWFMKTAAQCPHSHSLQLRLPGSCELACQPYICSTNVCVE